MNYNNRVSRPVLPTPDGPERGEQVTLMNDSTGAEKKSRVQDGLRQLLLLVKLLEDEGIKVVTAEASITRGHDILFSGGFDLFRKWCEKYALKPECQYRPDCDNYLTWTIRTKYHGVDIHSYMTDRDKEAYDAAEEA